MTPRILSAEEFSTYSDEFEYIFSDADIRNIALSGQYGAGKSSVMKTYEENQQAAGHNFVHISLANFNEVETGDDGIDGDETCQVEEKILTHLVHQLDINNAPKSRFKKTSDSDGLHDIILAVSIVLFAVLSILLLRWYGKAAITGRLFIRVMISAVAWMLLLFSFVYQAVRRESLTGVLRKLKFGDLEVDLSNDNKATPLDRYMDDIVYLINSSNKDVVVFEDLDRFGSVGLFEKLREINELANATRKNKAPLRFFYLIRDGLFSEARDRTKFFDFIIPVVPFVDPSNAESILIQRLKSVGVEIDQTFLYQLALFINDPRILTDILNEFQHYATAVLPANKTRLASDEYGRLLAMIAFKALFPGDFEFLQIGRGCIATLLEKRRILVSELLEVNKRRIVEIDEELKEIKSLNQLNNDELTLLYGARSPEYPLSNFLNSQSTQQTMKEVIKAIRKNQRAASQLDQLAVRLEAENSEYVLRVQEASGSEQRRSLVLSHEKQELERLAINLNRMCLADLLDYSNEVTVDKFFELKEQDFKRREDFRDCNAASMMSSPDYPLVKFLLISGMIDESYRRYTSYLHSGLIGPDDAEFVVAVLQGKGADEERKIYNPDAVLIRLDDRVLGRVGARNRMLFSRLIERDDEKTESFVRGIGTDVDFRFLAEYICSEQYKCEVFELVERTIQITVLDLLNDALLPMETRRDVCHRYMADCYDAACDDELSSGLGAFASRYSDFLEVRAVDDAAALVAALRHIGYRPSQINLETANDMLLEVVVSGGLFEPDATLVNGLLVKADGADNPLELGKLITAVQDRIGSDFFEAVNRNLTLFVSTVIADDPSRELHDSEAAIVWILSSNGINDELAEEYAKLEHGEKLQSLEHLVNAKRKTLAIECNLTACNAANVLGYVNTVQSVDQIIVDYLEENGLPNDLNGEGCRVALGSKNALTDFAATSAANISAQMLSLIAIMTKTHYPEFRLENVPDDRMLNLIDLDCIEMNADNLCFLRVHYGDLVHDFTKRDYSSYIDLVMTDSSLFERDEAVGLLAEDSIPEDDRLLLMEGLSGVLKVSSRYPDKINAEIVRNHFNQNDCEEIIGMYDSSSATLKEAIVNQLVRGVGTRGLITYILSMPLLLEVLKEEPNKSGTRELLVRELKIARQSKPSRLEVKRCLAACDWGALAEALDKSGKKLGRDEADSSIIQALTELEMISDKSRLGSDGKWLIYRRGLQPFD